MLTLQRGKNIHICYDKKYLHEFIYSQEKCDSIYLRRVSKKVGGDYPFKTSDIVQVPNVFWE